MLVFLAGDPRETRGRPAKNTRACGGEEQRRNLKNRTVLWLLVVGAVGQRGGSFLKHICVCARVYLWKVPPRRPAGG